MEITFEIKKPSEVRELIDENPIPFRDLILGGYDVAQLEPEDEDRFVMSEYDGDDDETRVYLGYLGNLLVCSLTLFHFLPETQHSFASAFFTSLKKLNNEMYQRLTVSARPFSLINGIVVHRSVRKGKISHQLINQANQDLHPVIISGQTRTPALLATFTQLQQNRSFFCQYELTGGKCRETTDHLDIHESMRTASNFTFPQPTPFLHTLLGTGLQNTLPYVSSFPLYVQQAFRPLIEVQSSQRYRRKTVMGMILSVRKEIF